MPTLELNSEELSVLQMCVALLLGAVFQNKVEVEKLSNIFKDNPRKLEALYSKLEHPGQKKKPKKTIEAIGESTMNST